MPSGKKHYISIIKNNNRSRGRPKGSKNKSKLISPAKTGQFAKGQSGNPKGRPQGSKSNFQIFAEKVGEKYLIKCLHLVGKAACGELTENDRIPNLEAAKIIIAAMPRPKPRWKLDIPNLPAKVTNAQELQDKVNALWSARVEGLIAPEELSIELANLDSISAKIYAELERTTKKLAEQAHDMKSFHRLIDLQEKIAEQLIPTPVLLTYEVNNQN